MTKKISLMKVYFARPRRKQQTEAAPPAAKVEEGRAVTVKIRTPITPRAVREQLTDVLTDAPPADKAAIIKCRQTELDKFLTDAQAEALERYAIEEENLERMKIGEFAGTRVQSSKVASDAMNDYRLQALSHHQAIKRRLDVATLRGLAIWSQQMASMQMAPNPEEAARQTGVGRTKDDWFHFLAKAADKLIAAYGHNGCR